VPNRSIDIKKSLVLKSVNDLHFIAKFLEIPVGMHDERNTIIKKIIEYNKSGSVNPKRIEWALTQEIENNPGYISAILSTRWTKYFVIYTYLGLCAIFLFLSLIDMFKQDFENWIPILENYFVVVATLAVIFFILIIVRQYLVPIIRNSKRNMREGKIWFYRYLSLEPSKSGGYVLPLTLRYIYNIFVILLAFVYILTLPTFITVVIVTVFSVLTGKMDALILGVLIDYILVIYILMILSFEFVFAGLCRKKHAYLFMYSKYHSIHSNEKIEFYRNYVLSSLQNYRFDRTSTEEQPFSKAVILETVAYYRNVALVLLSADDLFIREIPEFHQRLISENYDSMLSHLKELDQLCRTKPAYLLHAEILRTFNRQLDTANLLRFREGLTKVKPRTAVYWERGGNIIQIIDTRRNLIALCIITLLLIVLIMSGRANLNLINPINEINRTIQINIISWPFNG
jgi:hypothetical protein